MVERDSSYIMVAVPAFKTSLTTVLLPTPSLGESGGYKTLDVNGKLVPDYSPIDIAICGLTSLYTKEKQPIRSLNNWFTTNPHHIAEWWVSCTIVELTNNRMVISSKTIAEWKAIGKNNYELNIVLKRNAPFTMRS